MISAGEINNTETWSANLQCIYMTDARLSEMRVQTRSNKTEPIGKDQTVTIRMEHHTIAIR